ncbi:hypothetical protein AB1Y20_019342 [Prymnesium parvum]|uniref:Glutathione peroxidase n=1 Tax=Prymnesium parvum TaxID=97485 RepID=A0AB34JUC6_PRYPA
MAGRRLLYALLAAGAFASSIYDIEVDDLQSGLPVGMSYYKGKALLIVNVASQCGYTEFTYQKLNQLHQRYASRGLAILGFPCNQFGEQEPGTPEDIFDFAHNKKRAAFDLFRKVEVSGPNAHPLFKWLLGVGGDCVDQDASCPQWAEAGECERNKEFMAQNCKLSCAECSSPQGAQAPIRWNFESFLVTRAGNLHLRWPTGTDLTAPEQTKEIEHLLEAKEDL